MMSSESWKLTNIWLLYRKFEHGSSEPGLKLKYDITLVYFDS